MSYVSLGAIAKGSLTTSTSSTGTGFVKPVVAVKPLSKLQPLYTFVKANRDFSSKLIVKWLDENRGIPGVEIPGLGVGEKGVKNGGVAQTVVKGQRVSLATAYNTLKVSTNQNKAQYDTLRATALSVILERDFTHVLNCAAAILIDGKTRFDWNGLFAASGQAFSALGTSAIDTFTSFTSPFSPSNFQAFAKNTAELAKVFERVPATPLGAFTAQGTTISYYEDPRLLSFSDRNLKSFYEGLRDADLNWQKTMGDFNNFCKPFYGFLTALTGNTVNFGALANAARLPLPTAPLAAILEITAGNKTIDRSFYDLMALQQQQMTAMTGAFAFVGTVCGATAGILAATGVGLPVAAGLGSVAAIAAPAATAAGIASATLGFIKPGQVPTRAQFGDLVKTSSLVLLRSPPSEAEIDKMYAKLLEVESGVPAPSSPSAPPNSKASTGPVRIPSRSFTPLVPTKKQEEAFPVLPLLAAAGIGYLLISKGRK